MKGPNYDRTVRRAIFPEKVFFCKNAEFRFLYRGVFRYLPNELLFVPFVLFCIMEKLVLAVFFPDRIPVVSVFDSVRDRPDGSWIRQKPSPERSLRFYVLPLSVFSHCCCLYETTIPFFASLRIPTTRSAFFLVGSSYVAIL
jgi:hypothetical protein